MRAAHVGSRQGGQFAGRQAGRFEGRQATPIEGKATQLDGETRLEGRQAGRLDGEQATQSEARRAGPLTRLFRWWLEHWIRYAEVGGAQWR